MYVVITNNAGADVRYSVIRTLSFAPSADLSGSSLPINEYTVELLTGDDIAIGQIARLYDDLGVLWACYRVAEAEHIDSSTLRLKAQSDIALLDGVILPAEYFNAVPVGDVLGYTITTRPGIAGTIDYTLDSGFDGQTITGYCPEQSARVRLMWVCFVIGGWVKTFCNDQIEILPISTTAWTIPLEATYWRPKVTFKNWVTKIYLYGYRFTEGTPTRTQEYVETDDGTVYIMRKYRNPRSNSDAPADAPENAATVEGVYLVNQDRATYTPILARLKDWYFKRTEVELEAINNAEYFPGDRVRVYSDTGEMYEGYVTSCEFAFGLQAKSKIKLTAAALVTTGTLLIRYTWEGMQLGVDRYTLPVGDAYSFATRDITEYLNGQMRRFHPTQASVEGTMTAAGAEVEVVCEEVTDT